jgi:putative peptidoglycan lipid II flippase
MRLSLVISSLTRRAAERVKSVRVRLPGTSGSPNRKILRAAIIIGLLTLVAKMGATVKELMVAGRFGRSDAVDAFLIAYLLPSFMLLLVRGACEPALIPVLVEARHKRGAQAAQALFSSMMFLSVLAAAAIAVLLGLMASGYLPYLAPGFSQAKLHLTRELLYALLPFVVFSTLAGNAAAVLNASERFTLPAIVPLMTPLATILFIAVGPRSWGPFLLVGGVVAGSLLEAALLAQALRGQGMRLKLQWNGFSPDVRAVLKQSAPMLGGILLMSGTGVVDQSMATMLSPGSVSALSYANKIVSVVLGIGYTALSTGAFPYLAKMVAQNDWTGCRHTLKRYSTLVAAVTLPIMGCLILFSRPLVRLLYQRGAFINADTELVSWVQICYSLQIPFYIGCALFVRFLSSIRRNDILMYASGGSLILDIALNLALMKIWGVAGIALSTSLVYIFSFTVVSACAVKLLGQQPLHAGAAAAASARGPGEAAPS